MLTFCLNDAPYENARTVTALRLIDAALGKGHDVTVFCYEGAVSLGFSKQMPHANAVHGRSVEEEDHPLPKDWILALMEKAKKKGVTLDWIHCGLCVDERGVHEGIPGTRRGSPADLLKASEASAATLIIPTR